METAKKEAGKVKRSIAVTALCVLVLSGCAGQTDTVGPAAEEAGKVNPQMQALEQAEQAGLLDGDAVSGETLSEEEVLRQMGELFDTARYMAAATGETLSVGAEAGRTHEYLVVEVRDEMGESVGKLAVDRETGETYHYLGDGVLDDYATFPLYDPAAVHTYGWAGSYAGPASVGLEIVQEEEGRLTYCFSDGTEGVADITGETAKSADGEINFLLAENIVTVAGGGLTGNYTAQPAVTE